MSATEGVGGLALAADDEWNIGQPAQAQSPVRGGERRVGGDEEDVGVFEQLDRVERAVPERREGESQLELAGLKLIEQAIVPVVLDELDLNRRRPLGEAAQERRRARFLTCEPLRGCAAACRHGSACSWRACSSSPPA
jgi:hypothetical protein